MKHHFPSRILFASAIIFTGIVGIAVLPAEANPATYTCVDPASGGTSTTFAEGATDAYTVKCEGTSGVTATTAFPSSISIASGALPGDANQTFATSTSSTPACTMATSGLGTTEEYILECLLTAKPTCEDVGSYPLSFTANPGTDGGTAVTSGILTIKVPGSQECSSTTTTPNSSIIALGESNTDSARVTGSGAADPTGTVSFYACGVNVVPCTLTGTPFDVETLDGTSNPSTATSASFTPNSAGTWCFAAVYSGDSNYGGSSDQITDECYRVPAANTTITTPTNSSIALGNSNTDEAAVTGSAAGGSPTGSVSFYECGPTPWPQACTSTANPVGSAVGVSAGAYDTSSATSESFTPDATGYWCFAGYYSGDSTYPTSSDTSTDECFFVGLPSGTAVTTMLSAGSNSGSSVDVPENTAVTDSATLAGSGVSTAGGSVTYTVYTDNFCSDAVPNSSSTVAVIDGSVSPSSPVTLSTPGNYYWQAAYGGDANDLPSQSTCATETETVYLPGPGGPPAVEGTVTDSMTSHSVVGALVQICTTGTASPTCHTTTTSMAGAYSVTNLAPGQYELSVWPPSGSTLLEQAQGPLSLSAGTVPINFALTGPTLPPTGTTITGSGAYAASGGIPGIVWDVPTTLSVQSCPSGTGTFDVTAINSQTGVPNTVTGTLTESPVGSGDYVGTIPPLFPVHGPAVVTAEISCPDGSMVQFSFNIYIDPSGTVVNTSGTPIAGAKVGAVVVQEGVRSVQGGPERLSGHVAGQPGQSGHDLGERAVRMGR